LSGCGREERHKPTVIKSGLRCSRELFSFGLAVVLTSSHPFPDSGYRSFTTNHSVALPAGGLLCNRVIIRPFPSPAKDLAMVLSGRASQTNNESPTPSLAVA
jgi:hypothetical protein